MGGQSLAERVPRQRKGAGLARFCVTLRASRAGLRRIAWINHFINNVYDDNE